MGAGLSYNKNGIILSNLINNIDVPKSIKGTRTLIVGGTSGIGRGISISLLNHEGEVTIVGRKEPTDLIEKYGKSVQFINTDLSSMKNAKNLVNKIKDIETLDHVIFTNGIITTKERKETDEGLELDLAVSYLSRYVIIYDLIQKGFGDKPLNNKQAKLFIMGYPGAKTVTNLDDINSENSYKQIPAHLTTVVGNESLVIDLAKKQSKFGVYGLNPGLIKTGIREAMTGTGIFGKSLEYLIGLFNISAEEYAENTVVPLIALDLSKNSGISFDQKGFEILPNAWLVGENENNYIRFLNESEKLLSTKVFNGEKVAII